LFAIDKSCLSKVISKALNFKDKWIKETSVKEILFLILPKKSISSVRLLSTKIIFEANFMSSKNVSAACFHIL